MRWAAFWTTTLALLMAGGLGYAQSEGGKSSAAATKSAKRDGKPRLPIAITPEREAAVLTFVQRNHAELVDLLGYLKTNQPEEYERAVREIFRATERLAQIQERDPLQYELEVAAWSAQSHVQLLAARLQMGSSEDLLKQLRTALVEQQDARLALIKHDRKKTADRLSKLDSDIARIESDKETIVDRQLKTLTRAATEGRPVIVNTGKGGAKSAVKAKTNSTKTPTN